MKMPKAIRVALLGSITLILLTVSLRVAAQPGTRVSFQIFYDQLAPYGDWVRDPDYGYIWLPNAGPDFMPYASNGYWVMTNYGNTWVSEYAWGWAPFHYGRWVHSDWYGWAWVPGYEWGPAWVSWRNGGGYYGWAPLGPGVNISVNIRIPAHHWVFVPSKYITHKHVHKHMVPRANRVTIYNRTTVINNVYVINNHKYISGPSHKDIERITKKKMVIREVKPASRPERVKVDSRSVSIYKPNVDERSRNQARPIRVVESKDVKTRQAAPSVRNSTSRPVQAAPRPTNGNASRKEVTRPSVPTKNSGNNGSKSQIEKRSVEKRPERTHARPNTAEKTVKRPAARESVNQSKNGQVSSRRTQGNTKKEPAAQTRETTRERVRNK